MLEGHEDWVRCLSFSPASASTSTSSLTLASGSQDGNIRLWAIEQQKEKGTAGDRGVASDDILDAFEKSLGDVGDGEGLGGRRISNRSHVFAVRDPQGT